MTLAIFDLDNTLIAGDSDHLWGEFLCDRGIVDVDHFRASNERFYADYRRGELDIRAYLDFALEPLKGHTPQALEPLRAEFMRDRIAPIMLPRARELLQEHRLRGHRLLIITATNEFVTRPIAEALQVPTLLGCAVELRDGVFTGSPEGTLSYREGKVQRLQEWLAEESGEATAGANLLTARGDLLAARGDLLAARGDLLAARGDLLKETWFYSDSHNDIPLLELVDHPVAVDPDRELAAHAAARGWEQVSLR